MHNLVILNKIYQSINTERIVSQQIKVSRQINHNLKTRAPHAVPTLLLVKKRGITDNLAFRVMPLVLQLHLVMMIKYSIFGIDTFNTF